MSMLEQMIQWFKVEPSKKVILLTLGLGAASVLIALLLAVVVLCLTSQQPLDYPPILLPLLLMMGQTSQILFQLGPILLVIGTVIGIGKKIRLYNRRKPKEQHNEKTD